MHLIQDIYSDYIQSQNEEYRKIYKEYEGWFGASSVGQCYRKQWYRAHNVPEKDMNNKSKRVLRLGTILHRDIENGIRWAIEQGRTNNIEFYLEETIKLPDLKVIGHLDIACLRKSEGQEECAIYDLKTAKAYTWQKRFGHKKNRDPHPSRNYEMQVSTYALGFSDLKGIPIDNIDMYILWYRKDDSTMKPKKVSPHYIQYALEYWTDLNETLADIISPDELIPGEEPNVPVQNWECSYCLYTNVCDGKKRIDKITRKQRSGNAKRYLRNL